MFILNTVWCTIVRSVTMRQCQWLQTLQFLYQPCTIANPAILEQHHVTLHAVGVHQYAKPVLMTHVGAFAGGGRVE